MAKKSSKQIPTNAEASKSPSIGLSLGDLLRKAMPNQAPESSKEPSEASTSPAATKTATSKQAQPPELKQCRSIVLRHERKGHGGKTVTTLSGIDASPDSLAALAQKMKKALGCGARVEDNMIVLQGELLERTRTWLEAQGAPNVVLGTRPPR
ncbi:MAG: translation initiation factor [Myxococcales bacterium]|nr:translation initiation factor [Myxococcales bacterium]MCB9642448.1 translation initiation factor [Myxococcales bacterium]